MRNNVNCVNSNTNKYGRMSIQFTSILMLIYACLLPIES